MEIKYTDVDKQKIGLYNNSNELYLLLSNYDKSKIVLEYILNSCKKFNVNFVGFLGRRKIPKYYYKIINMYFSIKTDLEIDDKVMINICNLLNELGFETFESCEGHGKNLPYINFICENELLLRKFVYMLSTSGLHHLLNYNREITLGSGDPCLNDDPMLFYCLKPSDKSFFGDYKDLHDKFILDLDIIGVLLLDYVKSGGLTVFNGNKL